MHHVTYSSDNGTSCSLAALEHPSNSITISVDNANTYIVGVRAGNDIGWSGWTNSAPAGPYAPPAPPTVTAERSEDGLSATVSWTAYTGGDFSSYQVIVCTDAQYDGTSCSGTVYKSGAIYGAASTGPVTVTGLDAQTGYGVILQTWRTSGALKSHATIAALPKIPAAPSNFTVTNGDGYYDLDWDAVSGAAAYDIRAKVANSSSWSSVATGVTATSYRYTTSEVVNAVAVRGVNAGGAGPWAELSRMPSSDWLNVVIEGGASSQSAQAQSQLAAPASITVTRRNHSRDEKIYVTWAAVTGADGYNLACANTPLDSNTPYSDVSWWHCGSVDSGSTTTFTVDHDKRKGITRDLAWDRSYAVSVRAVTTNPVQASPWLMSDDAHPAIAPFVETTAVSRAAGSISLSWTSPQHAQGYEIECATRENNVTGAYTLCADVDNANVAKFGTIHVTISSWTASGTDYTIDDAKTYDLRLRTTNTWGDSPYNFAPLIHPSMVSNLAITDRRATGFHSARKEAVAFTTGSNSGGYVLKSVTVPLKKVNARHELLT